jgi:chemotaxis protein CheC
MMIDLSAQQLDTLNELVNIGVGRAANTLYELTDMHILISIPNITFVDIEHIDELSRSFGNRPVAVILQQFSGEYGGRAGLIIPEESAIKLVTAITGETPLSNTLDALQGETLSEIGNIVINAMIGSISNVLGTHRLHFELAEYYKDEAINALKPLYAAGHFVLIARINFNIRELQIEGYILLTFDMGTASSLLEFIDQALQ